MKKLLIMSAVVDGQREFASPAGGIWLNVNGVSATTSAFFTALGQERLNTLLGGITEI